MSNVVDLGDGTFAVKKYLLPPKYYKQYPEVKHPDNTIIVNEEVYIVLPAEYIIDELDEFLAPHAMDDYKYPMMDGFKPYAHQIYTTRYIAQELLTQGSRGCHIHSSMGVGKSISTLWALDYLFSIGKITKVLIISPKVVMRSAWGKEIVNHFLHLDYCIKEKKARDLVSTAKIDIINHDGLTTMLKKYSKSISHGENKRVMYDFTNCVHLYDVIIYDEATAIKTVTTARWKTLNKYFEYMHSRNDTKLLLITGTPIAQSPVDAYAQAKLINPSRVPSSLTKWRDLTMRQIDYNGYKFEANEQAHALCTYALQPSVRFELSDSTDLPDHTFIDIVVEKTERQHKLFNQMARDFIMSVDSETDITAINGAAKATKLLQLLAGAVYDSEKNVVEVEATNKVEALCELINQLPPEQPVVVFAEYKMIQQLLKDKLAPIYDTVEVINGETSGEERSMIVERVLNCQTKVVIAHPATCSMGVDFTSTNVIIWYSPTYRSELYLQALDRIRRLSSLDKGFDKFFVYHLVSDPVEIDIYRGLHDKSANQDAILQRMRDRLIEQIAY